MTITITKRDVITVLVMISISAYGMWGYWFRDGHFNWFQAAIDAFITWIVVLVVRDLSQ